MSSSERLKKYWEEVRAGKRAAPQKQPRKPRQHVFRKRVRCDSSWARNNEVVLTLLPHGELAFKVSHQRMIYKVGLPEVLRVAVLLTIKKVNARVKELKKGGYTLGKARKKAQNEIAAEA